MFQPGPCEACVPARRAAPGCGNSVAWIRGLSGLLQNKELQKLYRWPKGACPLEEHIKNGNWHFAMLFHPVEIQLLRVAAL